MKTTNENYEPYGDEWEKEVMKLPKKMIVDMYRNVCIKLKDKEVEVVELEIMLKDIQDDVDMWKEAVKEAEINARDTYKDRGW